MIKFALPIAISLMALNMPTTASAGQIEIRVPTADLDLTSQEGRNNLQARLRTAAREACGVERTPGVRGQSRFRACVAVKVDKANQDRDAMLAENAGSPLVASLR